MSIKTGLMNFYRRQQFYPGFTGLLLNPFYFARKGLLDNLRKLAAYVKGNVLDVGCGTKPYAELYSEAEFYIGLEVETQPDRHVRSVDVIYDGSKFPFANNSFDTVIANQVLEHVFTPDNFLKEVCRVLKKDGRLLLTVPFVWDEHEQPYDYARYASFGLKSLLEKHNMVVEFHYKSINDFSAIIQLVNGYLYKALFPKNKVIKILLTMLIIGPINIIGSVLAKILPKNNDLYLDNVVLAKRM